MNAQKKFFLSFGFVVALVVAWFALIYLPINERISSAQIQTHKYTARIDSAFAANKNLDVLRDKLEEVKLKNHQLTQRLVDPDDLRNINRRLRAMFAANNLILTEFKPNFNYYLELLDDTSNHEPLHKLPITITLRGQFFDLARVLENLNNRQIAISPEGFVLKPYSEYSSELSIIMNIAVFVKTRA